MAAQQEPQPTQAIDQPLPPPPQIPKQEVVPPAPVAAPSSLRTERQQDGKVLTTPAVRKIAKDNQVRVKKVLSGWEACVKAGVPVEHLVFKYNPTWSVYVFL